MAEKELLLGIDLGTSGCKVTLIDTDCNFIGDGYTEYTTYHPNIGWSEQDPADWFPAFMRSFGIALEKGGAKASQVVALSLDASAHNIVLLDKDDRVLRKTIMWTDTRATEESAFMTEHYGSEIFRIGYQMPSPTWSMLQLMWIKKHEPEVMEKAARAMFVKDYVRYQLTGVWTTDHVEAQGSLLFDNINWCWSEDLCRMSGIPISILPPLVKPTDISGHITAEASAITGIRAGTPVINGATDTALEAYCVGAIHENNCVTKLATSGTIYLFRKEAHPDPKALTYSHVVDGLRYGEAAKQAIEKGLCTKAVENVIEANTLLSGLGFENTGESAAHGIHSGLTAIPATNKYFHGEKVAFGTLCEMVLENAPQQEFEDVMGFCYRVGLPITLGDLGVEATDENIHIIAKKTVDNGLINSEPVVITEEVVFNAIAAANLYGENYKKAHA